MRSPNDGAVLISTVPRSGTFYCHYFFHIYNQLICGEALNFEGVTKYPKDLRASTGSWPFVIGHTYCPGFKQALIQSEHAALWEALAYDTGWDYGTEILDSSNTEWDPVKNSRARFVLVYRNPFDQALSHYRHTIDLDKYGQNDEKVFKDVRDFFHDTKAIEKYLKMFLTFTFVEAYSPGSVLLVPYELMVRNPAKAFRDMVSHITYGVGQDKNPLLTGVQRRLRKYPFFYRLASILHHLGAVDSKALNEAISATNPDAMTAYESKLGHALTGPHVAQEKSHMHGGHIGEWKDFFNDKDMKYVEAQYPT